MAGIWTFAGVRARCTPEEFAASPIVAGCMVLTRPARHCALAKQSPSLAALPYWAWRIHRVMKIGAPLPANSRHIQNTVGATFEAHLYCPEGGQMSGIMQPLWDVQPETLFLSTVAEKRGEGPKRKKDPENHRSLVHVPILAFLRPENIVGGGFQLSRVGRLPPTAMDYAVAAIAAGTDVVVP
jgi:hypothetical protein